MEANLDQIRALAPYVRRWLIGGVGGTSASAAEVILAVNPKAEVIIVGGDPPAGLFANDQFGEILRNYGRQEVVGDRLVDKPDADRVDAEGNPVWRLTVRQGDRINDPATLSELTDGTTGYRIALTDRNGEPAGSYEVDGYVAGIGRDRQAPPVLDDLVQQALRDGRRVEARLMMVDKRFVGYQVRIEAGPHTMLTFRVTGAASRWPPTYVPGYELVDPGGPFDITYAPAESGNFGGGYGASAEEAKLYADRWRRWGQPASGDRAGKEDP
jgi:hypothetical protein